MEITPPKPSFFSFVDSASLQRIKSWRRVLRKPISLSETVSAWSESFLKVAFWKLRRVVQSCHVQYCRTVTDPYEQLTDRTLRAKRQHCSRSVSWVHRKRASHYYIRAQCATVRTIRTIRANDNGPYAWVIRMVIFLVPSLL